MLVSSSSQLSFSTFSAIAIVSSEALLILAAIFQRTASCCLRTDNSPGSHIAGPFNLNFLFGSPDIPKVRRILNKPFLKTYPGHGTNEMDNTYLDCDNRQK